MYRFVLGCLAVLAIGPAMAGDDTTPPPAAPSAAAPSDLDRVQCRKYPPPLGSRIGERHICHTKREWDEIERNSQDAVNGLIRQGDQSGSHNSGGGPGGGGG